MPSNNLTRKLQPGRVLLRLMAMTGNRARKKDQREGEKGSEKKRTHRGNAAGATAAVVN